MMLAEADTLPVNGHCNMSVLVSVDSDDDLNSTTTLMNGDSCHCHLLEVEMPAR